MRQEFKALTKLALPIIGTQVAMHTIGFVDNVMAGQLGSQDLASLSIAHGFFSLTQVIFIGTLGGLSPFFGNAFGRNDHQEIGNIFFHGIIFSILIGMVSALAIVLAKPILQLFNQPEILIPGALEYIYFIVIALPAFLVFNVIRNFLDSTSDTAPCFIAIIIAAVINVPLDYALMLGKWGAPNLGLRGAAIASTLLFWLVAIGLLIYLKTQKRYECYSLFRWRPIDWSLLKQITSIGIPLGGAVGLEMSFFTGCTFLAGMIGVVDVAAHQIALNSASMLFMIPLGLSFAVSIRISQHMGEDQEQKKLATWKASVALSTITQLITASVFIFFPIFIIQLYGADENLAPIALSLMGIAAAFQLFDGYQVVGMGLLRGIKDTRFALVATCIAFWVIGFPIAYHFGLNTELKTRGIWYGMLVGLGVASIIHHIRFYRKLK